MINTLPLYTTAPHGTYADYLKATAPLLEAIANGQKQCPSCEEWYPNAEFEHPFYCRQSEGMESETSEVCRECIREQNDQDDHERRMAATADYSKL